MADVIGVYTKKGGTGKTHTIINLSAQMALNKKRVLVIDGEPQRNATQFFLALRDDIFDGLAFIDKRTPTLLTVLEEGMSILNTTIGVDYKVKRLMSRLTEKFYVTLPAHIDLVPGTSEIDELKTEDIYCLKKEIERVRKEYDYILIDFPPATNDLTLFYLTACDYIIVPFELGRDSSLAAYSDVMDFCEEVKLSGYNPDLEILGVYFNRVRDYKATHKRFLERYSPLKEDMRLFDTYIPEGFKSCDIAEELHEPLCISFPREAITKAYADLAKEIGKKIGVMKHGK